MAVMAMSLQRKSPCSALLPRLDVSNIKTHNSSKTKTHTPLTDPAKECKVSAMVRRDYMGKVYQALRAGYSDTEILHTADDIRPVHHRPWVISQTVPCALRTVEKALAASPVAVEETIAATLHLWSISIPATRHI